MVCFPCLSPNRKRLKRRKGSIDSLDHENKSSWSGGEMRRNAHSFDLKELSVATENFKESNLIGKDGIGNVFKGFLENQEVAIKKFNRDAMQGNEEFLMLTVLTHPNLVNLIGYCAEGEERLLVYEYMSRGSLNNHLFDLRHGQEPLSWNTRVKIALGAAKGLAYLHDVADPPVIYRDLKSSNILLDEDFNSKLSDFGLARLGPVGEDTDVSTTVMGTNGYCAPDYAQSGKLNVNSDVYSFGVVLLELISGRRVFEFSLGTGTESLIEWSRPFFNDRSRFTQLADPLLQGRYPLRGFYQLVSLISMCLHDRAEIRPFMRDVVSALKYVASQPYGIDIGCNIPSAHTS